jgi:hypothetical protein
MKQAKINLNTFALKEENFHTFLKHKSCILLFLWLLQVAHGLTIQEARMVQEVTVGALIIPVEEDSGTMVILV